MSRTTRILLVVGVTAAALAAYWYLALAPKRAEIAKLDTDIAGKQAAVQTAQATANNYESTRKAYRTNYETVVRLGKAVPADDDVRSLVVQLDSSAERAKIDFNNIALTDVSSGSSAADPAASQTFVTQPFSFSFKGSFFRLSDFFNQLDRFVQVNGENIDVNGRLLRIESFNLTPQGAGSDVLNAQIGATSYSLPESENLTADATAQGPAGAQAAPAQPAGTTPASNSTTPTTTATAGGNG